jgi:hypothetical protein
LDLLMFYNSERGFRLHGYRRSVYEMGVLAGMPKLRMLYVDPEDVTSDADFEYMEDIRWQPWANGYSWSCHEDIDFFVEYFMANAISDSVEILVLGTLGRSPLSEEEAEFFDHAIARLIEIGAANYLREARRTYSTCQCGRHTPPNFIRGSLPNPIKAVYLSRLWMTSVAPDHGANAGSRRPLLLDGSVELMCIPGLHEDELSIRLTSQNPHL